MVHTCITHRTVFHYLSKWMTYQQPALYLCQVSCLLHSSLSQNNTALMVTLCGVKEECWPCKVEVHEHRSCPVNYSYVLRTPLFNVSDTSPWLTQEGGGGMNCTPLLFSCFWGTVGDLYYMGCICNLKTTVKRLGLETVILCQLIRNYNISFFFLNPIII